MIQLSGKGVYSAVAVGRVAVFKRQDTIIERIDISDITAELERFEMAKSVALSELRTIYENVLAEVGEEDAAIFDIHIMMLEDEDYNDAITGMINAEYVNAEYAVAMAADSFAKMFAAMDDAYMQARSADVRDISKRVIKCLTGVSAEKNEFCEPVIICADDLAPSETVSLDKSKVLAFVTAKGSANSHTAILARSLGIPAIVAVGDELLFAVKDGDTAIADGYTGEFVVSPDEEALVVAKDKQCRDDERKALLSALRGKDSVTMDGRRICICANIGSTDDIASVLENDADGIGLFRSEFLYLGRSNYPSENEQFAAYKRVLQTMGDKKVIIRTLDIGADKQADYFGLGKEENPAMGLRAIRICLTRPEIFKVQLRALYRASVYGKLGIMFPMITSVSELSEILEICETVKAELKAEGKRYSDDVEIGIMIETPAAAILSDRLATMVDFFSIGTNDLTQYTLACDRQNQAVERFCDTHHEAVLRLIEMSVENAHKYGKWIGICGELAADASLTEYFLRLGIDELSVSPAFVLSLRDKVRGIDLEL